MRAISFSAPRRQRVSVLRFLALIVLALAAIPPAQAQHPELDALASDTAAAIARSSQHSSRTNVLVVDFNEAHGPSDRLGRKLARDFADSLAAKAIGFSVLDRGTYVQMFAADKLTPESYADPETAKCYALELKATVIVDGEIDLLPDRIVLWVRASQIKDKNQFFDQRISLPLTPELGPFLTEHVARPGAPPERTAAWVNPSHPPVDDVAAARGRGGRLMPSCVYCPSASFNRAARNDNLRGTVALQVQVADDGTPTQITVLRGLPCGLNQDAVNAVARWQFKPPTGADGEPVPSTTSVEISFR